ncbi:phage head closure protein [Cohnella xylanilytica]|uniref:Phage head closure protein n=1 Tax=Cohnella xylanilytica TaxID=557555 RepID=A0A841U2X0_9BACL|nr:phage head closure protein [Cohnella xylanilytica]MBB6692324.1 phage head closure protein [Cohnella xylanilytica]
MAPSQQKRDKKISILGKIQKVDPEGIPVESWEPITGGENIWAYYRQASAKEFYEAAATNYRVDAIFHVNWRDDVDSSMMIRFRGEDYNISRIDDFEGYKRELKIHAYKLN